MTDEARALIHRIVNGPWKGDGCTYCGSQEWGESMDDVEHGAECPVRLARRVLEIEGA